MKNISIDSIPEKERFIYPVQSQKIGKSIEPNSVLAHCDLNPTNLLLDNNLKIVSIIDWDSMSIVSDSDKDSIGFEKLWDKYTA